VRESWGKSEGKLGRKEGNLGEGEGKEEEQGQWDVDERRRTGRKRTGGYLRQRIHAKKSRRTTLQKRAMVAKTG